MSVINKMLRDLDSRQASVDVLTPLGAVRPESDSPKPGARGGLAAARAMVATAGTRPSDAGRLMRTAVRTGVLGLLALTAVAATVWWWQQQPIQSAATVLPAVATQANQANQANRSASPASTVQVTAIAIAQTVASAAQPLPMLAVSQAKLAKPLDPPVLMAAKSASAQSASAASGAESSTMASAVDLSLKLSLNSALSPNPATDAAATLQGVQPLVPPGTPAVAKQTAPDKPNSLLALVAQAQAFWADGERSAALQLLKGAMQRLESTPDRVGQADAATMALVREYSRCGLLSGQTAEVLATLDRLPPQWVGVADLWAIRGNAAQRLGRHAQAVAAYQQALQLSPNEPRWMLGAAVSMAASGQTGPAAEMAEKVRIARALPLDVANYLRQLGVPIKPD